MQQAKTHTWFISTHPHLVYLEQQIANLFYFKEVAILPLELLRQNSAFPLFGLGLALGLGFRVWVRLKAILALATK